MTEMTGIARMTRMTRLPGSSFSRTFKDTFPIFFKYSHQNLESMSFLVLPQHEYNFN